jgi:lipid-binding SYLF domain-containing protein
MQSRFVAAALAVLALVFFVADARAQAREEGRLILAAQVLEELRATKDQFIPDRLLERAYGIAVIPEAKKAAFVGGLSDGRGVLVVRDNQGRFTNPVFLRLTAASFGWQIGVQETDIVLVLTTRRSVEGITGGKITLGGDASVAAGPVGRQASAATDTNFAAEVYSYSRSRGLFAGLALDGAVLRIDQRANEKFYRNPRLLPSDVMAGTVTSNSESVQRFLRAVVASTGSGGAATAPGSVAAPQAGTAAPQAAAPASGAAKTYPMEDPQPGREPPR